MFVLFTSPNCGISYHEEAEAETLEELRPKMEKLDKDMVRWYVEEDGKFINVLCDIHMHIGSFMKELNKMNKEVE